MSLGPMMVGITGLTLTDVERDLLAHSSIGGVILFSRNFENPDQLKNLVREIKKIRDPHLLVGVDQEGGRVQRFVEGFTELPGIFHLGLCYKKNKENALLLSRVSGWLMAAELAEVGIDFSFAPVLDLDRKVSSVMEGRCFHAHPEVVSELAHAYIGGMRKAGMASVVKHFPGHGFVKEDSHVTLPVDQRKLPDILSDDILPFEKMIHFNVESIMVAHILFENVDTELVGFSQFWLQNVLREKLGFQGLIFSDDLCMKGVGHITSIAERAEKSLQAGCDMVLVCEGLEDIALTAEKLKDWRNPVAQFRLIRMHGKSANAPGALRETAAWQQAVSMIAAYEEPHTLEIET